MSDVIIGLLALAGGAFAFIAGLGVLNLPNLLNRMHASTKAGTLGSSLTLAAAAVHFGDAAISVRAIAIVLFLLLTAPIAAHMIGRAAVRVFMRQRYRASLAERDSISDPPQEQPDARNSRL